MTVRVITTAALKRMKNGVIGNPSAKLAMSRDTAFIHSLVGCLNYPPSSYGEAQGSQDDIRVEAAHVISSIAYGSEDALRSLLRANAPRAFLKALADLEPGDSTTLKSALARGLRVLSSSVAVVVGPSQVGMTTWSSDIRAESEVALNYLLDFDCLDIYLPLLTDKSTQTVTAIAQLIGAVVRCDAHRTLVTDWLPPAERLKEVKGKRGWERSDILHSTGPARQGGWVVRHLIALVNGRDTKLQEAALGAIAALAQGNPTVATALTGGHSERARDPSAPFSAIVALTKSRSVSVQLAASLCTAHVVRASAINHPEAFDHASALSVMHVVNRLLGPSNEKPLDRVKACYTLYYLVSDHKELCREAVERGTLDRLAALVKSITPLDRDPDLEEDEPESTVMLREACFQAIATLALHENAHRCDIADKHSLVPFIRASLTHENVGVRYAACQCVRTLSRAVSIIRTTLDDSGLAMALFEVFKKEGEDMRVTHVALLAMCNLVIEFSPLQPQMMKQGLLERITQLLRKETQSQIRLNALWLLRNLLHKSTEATKDEAMDTLGWDQLLRFATDPDVEIQEQAIAILNNLVADEAGCDLLFDNIDADDLVDCLICGLDSENEDVTRQTAHLLGNLANAPPAHQDTIFSRYTILNAIHQCLTDTKPDTRVPLLSCVQQLLLSTSVSRRRTELAEAGLIGTLRHLADLGTAHGIGAMPGGMNVSMSPGGRFAGHAHLRLEDEREVSILARTILDILELPGEYR
ncbi:ARM repeat-containing protein [Coniophora puteana RWD-64-598 SS2]|uniref:ARM repeat-containing protein n=1 Tax=Coniophora puteana (strain RWD-64-598) TaxID=741705 RepID=A0A5M3MZS9_CONPW|nr:ARM repeat-containing protein [Coniophora puteana RWD-64-598 SS2]EIW84663.1 ARM repeat-containing protein [Coniophora puteana RWD-64-598 SS2]